MKLTKDQRHTAYILMLDKLEEWKYTCLCSIWDSFAPGDKTWVNLKKTLPELFRKRTTNLEAYNDYWFRGYEDRAKALQECINETIDF